MVLVDVDADKCVNCHVCIAACPVKYCNDGSGDHVSINPDLCLGCGACIAACPHKARYGVDDADEWQDLLREGKPYVALLAPSAASNFPGRVPQLVGWLHESGARAVVDVSFGAELAVWGYHKHLEEHPDETVVCQPCPCIVSYIEMYQPELIKNLAPIGSPVNYAMAAFAKHRPELADLPMVFFSPCFAKKRELAECGFHALNVTFASLQRHLDAAGVRLAAVNEAEFDNPAAERGALFPTPGGLTKTLTRWLPGLDGKVRSIEGPKLVYEYLAGLPEQIRNQQAPLLVDCLNCEHGCNRGPGSVNPHSHPDGLEAPVAKRANDLRNKNRATLLPGTLGERLADIIADKRMKKQLSEIWSPKLTPRTYADRSVRTQLHFPDRRELVALFNSMGKFEEKDLLNCHACGYESCERMAVAILNGLNRQANCHYFQRWDSERKLRKQALDDAEHKEQMHAQALCEVEDRMRGETGKLLDTIRQQIEEMRDS